MYKLIEQTCIGIFSIEDNWLNLKKRLFECLDALGTGADKDFDWRAIHDQSQHDYKLNWTVEEIGRGL